MSGGGGSAARAGTGTTRAAATAVAWLGSNISGMEVRTSRAAARLDRSVIPGMAAIPSSAQSCRAATVVGDEGAR